ncbi:FAD binding domain-containing protein [Pleomassaria siparia CBS 279.74]|uniref:FAD binding domain-containing protein n=1 Tax=Pleomassaria siparia CBS 279.74 TaxID=1314801 RepID=A0A6G1KQV7_9PLEO|nr:FAD binding domain-containing protein [Pleomassaria siparia CBS 279.74]
MRVLSFIQLLATAVTVTALVPRIPTPGVVANDLKSLVSTASSVSVDLPARWSDYNLPLPSVVVNVASENDVAIVIKYCTKQGIKFLAQNGGRGWGKTFNLGSNGVLINLAALNKVTFSANKTQATIGGGAIIGDVIPAANAAGALVVTGNCNCLGALGAMLGAGYGNLMGEVGFGVDNIISLRVVIASGEVITVSKTSYPDLFWAMRGAGPNFGVVISATVKSMPATAEDRTAWINNLYFAPEKLPQVAQAIQDLPLLPHQRIYLVLTNSGNNNEPVVLVTGYLRKGTEQTGRAAFAPIYALGPSSESSTIADYEEWNVSNDGFCTSGGQKPAYSTTINNMQAQKWPEIWNLYTAFQKKGPNSAVLIERYNLTKAQSVPDSSAALSGALRRQAFAQAIVIPWYDDVTLEAEALTFGQKVRDIWSFSTTPTDNPTYINFAHGDESLSAIYGSSLPRLQTLKKTWDPRGAFTQWFPIK